MAFGDFTVTRASTKNVIGSNGLYQSVANNVPAFEFNTNGSYRGLLVEPGATNLWLYNQPADATGYATATNLTFVNASTNFTPAFATVNTVELLDATVSRTLRQNITVVNGTVYTLSFFVKVGVGVLPNTGSGNYRDFTLTINNSDVINYANITYQDVGGGVYRASFTFTSTGVNAFIIRKYDGLNNNNRVEVTGFQLETGSVATSPIVTTGSTASRVADAISLASASSLIGATEGTIYLNAEILKLNNSNFYIGVSDGTALGNAIYLSQPSSGNLQVLVRKTGNADGSIAVLSANWTAGFNKVAIVYTATTVRIYINGVDRGNTTFVALPTLNRVTLGSRIDAIGTLVGIGGYKELALFPTALDATQAIALTTP